MRKYLFGYHSAGVSFVLQQRWSSLAIHNEVDRLINNGTPVNKKTMQTHQSNTRWRVTVILGLRTDSGIGLKGLYPGHASLVIWNATHINPKYFAIEIYDNGTFASSDDVGVQPGTLSTSNTANTWFFTKSINSTQAMAMFKRIGHLLGKKQQYSEFFGNRYNGSYSCHTVVDDILSYGSLSSTLARPWSWGTVYFYSLSFGITGWHSSVMYNTKNY